jgi:hypothetical protein
MLQLPNNRGTPRLSPDFSGSSALILEYRRMGYNGQVFIHQGHHAELVYYGPTETAHGIYSSLKRFAADRKHGTGDWYKTGVPPVCPQGFLPGFPDTQSSRAGINECNRDFSTVCRMAAGRILSGEMAVDLHTYI